MTWQAAIDRTVQGLGYDLVDVERTSGGLLRVTIDRLPGQVYSTAPGDFVTVEDCELVTRQLQYLLEVESVDYARLEVSSPGLDRPLRKPADWARFVGADIEITLKAAFEGRKKWTGTLLAREGDGFSLRLPPPQPAGGARKNRKASPSARGAKPAPAEAQDLLQTLDFTLDEVRDARLVPVIDFKGRRSKPGDAAQEDGGQTP